ncbi:MAG: hypothetical protein FWF59_11145, partial [Turicibacter sp.]|nr:hypothetical protein [Turicibacter sp.]
SASFPIILERCRLCPFGVKLQVTLSDKTIGIKTFQPKRTKKCYTKFEEFRFNWKREEVMSGLMFVGQKSSRTG